MSRSMKSTLAVLALIATAGTAQAQSGNVTAEATVLAPLTLTPIRTMQFGNVFPGTTASVAASNGTNSGAIQIIGSGAAQVAISAQSMSASLACVGTCTGGVSTAIPLTLSATALVNSASSSPTGASAFTLGTAGANSNLASGNLWLILGGAITPLSNQAAGLYRGTIQINVSYTGL
jgi:hypothetical protein